MRKYWLSSAAPWTLITATRERFAQEQNAYWGWRAALDARMARPAIFASAHEPRR